MINGKTRILECSENRDRREYCTAFCFQNFETIIVIVITIITARAGVTVVVIVAAFVAPCEYPNNYIR